MDGKGEWAEPLISLGDLGTMERLYQILSTTTKDAAYESRLWANTAVVWLDARFSQPRCGQLRPVKPRFNWMHA